MRIRLLIILTAVLAIGCGGDAPAPGQPLPPSVARVDVTPPSATVRVGQQAHFSATARDASGNSLSSAITWSTSSASKAAISSDGTLTATDTGSITVTASAGGKAGTAAVTITVIPVSEVTIAAPATALRAGQVMQLSATARDSAGNALSGRKISWSSSATAIATVDTAGKVSALALGSVTITAASEGRSGAVALTVQAPASVQTVSVSVRSDLIVVGATTEKANAVLQSSDGDTLTGRSITWSSSNSAIAAVDVGGNIEARSTGTAQLTATSEGKSGSVTVVVESRTKYERPIGQQFWFFDGSDPRTPMWDVTRGGMVPQSSDTRQQIVIDETFSIPAGKTVSWENKIVWVRPKSQQDINVLGTLIVRNSLLLWDQTQYFEADLHVKAGGTLQIDNSYAFESNQYSARLHFDDGSTIRLDHYQGHLWTTMNGRVDYRAVNASSSDMTIYGVHDGTFSITDAQDLWFELFPAAGTFDFSLPRAHLWESPQLPSLWPNVTPQITNSWIQRIDVSLNTGVHVTLRDGTDGLGVGWDIHKDTPGYVTCEIHGLGTPGTDPMTDPGTLYQDKTWDLPCNDSSLRLVNTRLMNAWPNANANVHLKMYDSELVDPRNQGFGTDPPTFEIYNSTIVLAAATNGGRMYLENVTVVQDLEANGAGSTIWGYNVRRPGGGVPATSLVSGGRYIQLAAPGVPW